MISPEKINQLSRNTLIALEKRDEHLRDILMSELESQPKDSDTVEVVEEEAFPLFTSVSEDSEEFKTLTGVQPFIHRC